MKRQYRTSASLHPQILSGGGDFFRTYGLLEGWKFKDFNLMVEGSTDVRFLEIANRRYVEDCGLSLLDDAFGVLAIGEADDGGTYGMKEKLNTLWRLRGLCGQDGKGSTCRVVALLDDDEAGRDAFHHIEKRGARPWLDLFLLRRRYPQVTLPERFKLECEEMNKEYLKDKHFFCVIEDMVNFELINAFRSEFPQCFRRKIHEFAGGTHVDIHRDYKGKFVQFVERNSILNDVRSLIDLLKAFRTLFQLSIEGSPVV